MGKSNLRKAIDDFCDEYYPEINELVLHPQKVQVPCLDLRPVFITVLK